MAKNVNFNKADKNTNSYSFYSRVLEKPFDTLEELMAAEAAHFDKLNAKAAAAEAKKNDAKQVEEAFKNLNAARKEYKEKLGQLTTEYSDSLVNLKKAFEHGKKDLRCMLADAERTYDDALKVFIEKYPEGYHLTLRDGDFETTISSQTTGDEKAVADFSELTDVLKMLFGI